MNQAVPYGDNLTHDPEQTNKQVNEASKGEAEVLKVFAFQKIPLTKKEMTQLLSERGSRITSGNIGKYLQRLVNKKLLSKVERGKYEVSDRMFRAYIRLFKSKNDNNDKR